MVVNRRKKVVKYRGHSNHGGGMRKKRRGAGSRGGRGNAGTGKRAGHKKAGMPPQLGRYGFLPRRGFVKVKAVNVGWFTDSRVSQLLQSGKATKEGEAIIIDMDNLGYQKLLGSGNTSFKLKIRVECCTESAAEKIKAAGGSVTSEVAEE